MAKKKVTEAPDYRTKPRSFSITVYDVQGDPISTETQDKIVSYVENIVKNSGVPALAYSLNLG